MSDPAFLAALKSELESDPQTLGYAAANAGVEADAIADHALLTTANRTIDRETMSGSEIFEAITASDWASRDVAQKDDIKFVLSLGDNIQIAAGTKARAILAAALSGATDSVNNLSTISQRTVTRAEELGLGRVTIGDIQNARLLP